MEGTKHNRRWSIGMWVVTGFVAGALIRTASMWPEVFQRLQWAWGGGGGESAIWGEPLFYIVILGIPAGLIGGAIAFAVALTLRRLTKREV